MTRAIETCCLYLLLLVVALRPLVPESYHSSRTPLSASLAEVFDPAPVVTLIIDAAILLAAAGWLVARAIGPPRPYRRCGIEWGAVLVLVAGVVSCCIAGNKRPAINATVDWLMLPLLTLVLAQVLRERWQIRLALAVIIASAAVQAYECFNQILYVYPTTEELYEQRKEQIWAAQNIEPDSTHVALYERRMYSREASGYLAHSNVAGAYLVLTGLATLALAWTRWRSPPGPLRRLFAVTAGILGAAILAAATLTHSRGALLAGAAAIGIWVIRIVWSSWIERNRARSLLLGWSIVIGGVVAVVGHGLRHDRLPGASLNFRWQYWTASARLFADQYLTGVGRENFGHRYLKYKSITSPEEVTNPHNFLVTPAAEWGVIGLAGAVVMLVGASVAVTRPAKPQTPNTTGQPGRPLIWGAALAGGLFFVRLFLLGSADVNYLVVATAMPLIVWAVAFTLLSADTNSLRLFCNDPLLKLAVGINLCLLAFLLQDTINFAMFVPAAATTFFALLAIPIAARLAPDGPLGPGGPATWRSEGGARTGGPLAIARPRWSRALVAVACIALMAHVVGIVLPVGLAGAAIAKARRASERTVPGEYFAQRAYTQYQRAARIDPLDPTPLAECAAWLVGYAQSAADREAAIDRALELIDSAIRRDPYSTSLHRQKLHMCQRFFRLTRDHRHNKLAINPARRLVELYPQSPEAHADLGSCLLAVARESRIADLLTEAADHLRRALELDGARPSWEELRRLRPRQRQDIEAKIAETVRLLNTPL